MALINYVYYVFLISTMNFEIDAQEQCTGTKKSSCQTCTKLFSCVANSTSSCPSGKVCMKQPGDFDACTDPANVPGCKCKGTSGVTYQCDFYSNTTVSMSCYKGTFASSQACSESQVCFEETGRCIEKANTPGTTSTTTTVPSVTPCSEATVEPKKFNCTALFFCSTEMAPPNILPCDRGQIFSEIVGDCIDYGDYSCGPNDDGLFVDPFNCSHFYTCTTNGEDSDSFCDPGNVFNTTQFGCVPGNCTNECCTPCLSEDDVFAVDPSICISSYNQCVKDTDPVTSECDDGFKFESKNCPNGFYYNATLNSCTRSFCKNSTVFF